MLYFPHMADEHMPHAAENGYPEMAEPIPAEDGAHPRNAATEHLGALSVREAVTLNWEKVDELAESHEGQARALVAKAFENAEYIPAMAGAIARELAPEDAPKMEVIWPTAERIKEDHAGLRFVGNVLGWFGLGGWFDGLIERKARERIEGLAHEVVRPLKLLGRYESPHEQMLAELQGLHHELTTAGRGRGPTTVWDFLRRFNVTHIMQYSGPTENQPHNRALRHTVREYPLIGGMLDSASAIHPYLNQLLALRFGARAAGPEIVEGLEHFLHNMNVTVSPAAIDRMRQPLVRRAAQRFAPSRLQRVPAQVEAALRQVYELTPANGKRFGDEIYGLCRQINDAARSGADPRAIVDALLRDLKR